MIIGQNGKRFFTFKQGKPLHFTYNFQYDTLLGYRFEFDKRDYLVFNEFSCNFIIFNYTNFFIEKDKFTIQYDVNNIGNNIFYKGCPVELSFNFEDFLWCGYQ
jgi:hypothetical protein